MDGWGLEGGREGEVKEEERLFISGLKFKTTGMLGTRIFMHYAVLVVCSRYIVVSSKTVVTYPMLNPSPFHPPFEP